MKKLVERLPIDIVLVNDEPDGTFPHGVPNPLLPENRELTTRTILENGADFGIAWDGDFDRCFFYDANGQFIEGYYLVGVIAESLLARHPGATIIHDPRLTWNTQAIVEASGGLAVESKTGACFYQRAHAGLKMHCMAER